MSTISSKLPTAARILLGAVFFVFGLNGFFNFIPPPPPESMPEASVALAGAFVKSGYMIPLIKGTEVLGGALLLSNRFVPLALTLLAPVIVNIFAFHAFLAPSGLGMAIVIVLLEATLVYVHREAFRPMLRARVPSQGH